MFQEFYACAAAYDIAEIGYNIRCLKAHQAWFEKLSWPLIKLDGGKPLEKLLLYVLEK